MNRNMEWMLAVFPVLIGTAIIAVSIMSSGGPFIIGYLKLIALSSGPQNLIKNSVSILKFIVGPGGG